jgi:hypothetical protein
LVLTPAEVRLLLGGLNGSVGLQVALLHGTGTGTRLVEGLRLRVERLKLTRRSKSRASARAPEACMMVLPENRVPAPRQQSAQARAPLPRRDLAAGFGRVWLAGEDVAGLLSSPPRGLAPHSAAPMPRVGTR